MVLVKSVNFLISWYPGSLIKYLWHTVPNFSNFAIKTFESYYEFEVSLVKVVVTEFFIFFYTGNVSEVDNTK